MIDNESEKHRTFRQVKAQKMAQIEASENKQHASSAQITYAIEIKATRDYSIMMSTNDTDTAMKVKEWYLKVTNEEPFTRATSLVKNVVTLPFARRGNKRIESQKGLEWHGYKVVLFDKLSEFGYKPIFSYQADVTEFLMFQQQ